MRISPRFLGSLGALLAVTADAQEPNLPQLIPAVEIHQRRESVQRELDGNHIAIQDLYNLLDATPERNRVARGFLGEQIQRIDDRCVILYEELDTLDLELELHERLNRTKRLAERLDDEASQLRRAGLYLPAAARDAKARFLRRRIDNGTWFQPTASRSAMPHSRLRLWNLDATDNPDSQAATSDLPATPPRQPQPPDFALQNDAPSHGDLAQMKSRLDALHQEVRVLQSLLAELLDASRSKSRSPTEANR